MQISGDLRTRLKTLTYAQQEGLCNRLHRQAVSQNNDLTSQDLAYLLFLAEETLWPAYAGNATLRWQEAELEFCSRVKCIRLEMGLAGEAPLHNKTNEQRLADLLSVRSLTKLIEAQTTQSATV